MPRTSITKTTAPFPNPTAGVVVTMTAADVANLNQCTFTGTELLIAHNTGVSTRTITITSAPDDLGRLGTITSENILAGEIKVYGPFQLEGWKQSDGFLYFASNNAEVKFGAVVVKSG